SPFARVQVKAAVMDSCMTSPRCPVIVNCLPPRILVASMKMMSPPTGVQTSPTATPGLLTRSSTSFSVRNFGTPRNSRTTSGVTRQLDNFHAVPQRLRDGIHPVGRRNEQHFREVKRHVEIVIAERVVLLRIKHFHQRR